MIKPVIAPSIIQQHITMAQYLIYLQFISCNRFTSNKTHIQKENSQIINPVNHIAIRKIVISFTIPNMMNKDNIHIEHSIQAILITNLTRNCIRLILCSFLSEKYLSTILSFSVEAFMGAF